MLTSSSKSLNSLIRIEFELAPIHKKSDYRFLLIMEPLTIIYHAVNIVFIYSFQKWIVFISFREQLMKLLTILNQLIKILQLNQHCLFIWFEKKENSIWVLFRIKQRKLEEMEEDLLNEKIFEMIIEIKGLSLLLPEDGIYKQFDYFHLVFFSLFILLFF